MPCYKKHNQNGFTIHEMLIVIMISVVLLGISLVSIVTYMRHLQLAELDHSARELFLAAQNRAILLSSSQKLDDLVIQSDNSIDHVDVIPGSTETTQITVYYIHAKDAAIKELLPDGSFDPSLADGDFYITYEPQSGSVVDVFFSDGTLPVNGDFPTFYAQYRAASSDIRMDSRPMIGYYGGEAAQSGSTLSLRTPVINIYNENTLRAEVTYWIPRTLHMMGESGNVALDVTLTYEAETITLDPNSAQKSYVEDIAYLSYTYTWTLDSLKPEETQFYELFSRAGPTPAYGSDFALTAAVSYGGELKVNGARKNATDNSLFAKGSGEETAYITCLRHLQNLDAEHSHVAGKSAARQDADIEKVEDYFFDPIENPELQSYDGRAFSIYGLTIQDDEGTPAGLFGQFSGTENAPKVLQNIRLVDTAVTADGIAGALLGDGAYLTLTNCQVYWENHSEQATNLREVLGDSTTGLHYQIIAAQAAGGLAGRLVSATVSGCSASTLVQSAGPAGGLVGAGEQLTIERSYAAAYLFGPSTAGLIGQLTGEANISGSYAVGFLESTSGNTVAAGLCLGGGSAAVERTYSAMLFSTPAGAVNYPLCQNGVYTDTYYLDSDQFGSFEQYRSYARPYSVLIDPGQWDTLFGEGTFTSKKAAQSHPYNLQTTLSLTTFIYPGLKELDHWGDWGAQFQDGSLVYYEQYQNGKYGFSGGDVSHLETDAIVVDDGYAVAYRSTSPIAGIGATLRVTYQTAGGEQEAQFSYGSGGDKPIYEIKGVVSTTGKAEDYYLLPLPSEVVNTDYAATNFYQEITISDVAEGTEKRYYYSPHFAATAIPFENGMDLAAAAQRLRVEIRSPRHLYWLSRFPQYFASSHQYRFLQQLDIDYSVYRGYDLFLGSWSQAPIGVSVSSPFRGSYYGNYHRITGVLPSAKHGETAYQYVGLFGYSTGVLQNIIYQIQDSAVLTVSQSGSSSLPLYVGALAGYNGGTIENCAAYGVRLQANGYDYSTIYLGGLVGRNQGTIRSCAVDGASLSADASMSHAYAGGFVGENSASGIIDRCYAVGSVSVTQARYGTVYACGFAGRNSATLSRSYAATHLQADGEAQRYGFCPDPSDRCVYLNAGNFTYRGTHYAAQYDGLFAAAVTWEVLAGQADDQTGADIGDQLQAVKDLDMNWGAAVYQSEQTYPYPGVVTDASGDTIHYGQWPDRMALGTLGVYYWEELVIDQTVSYHLSAISLADGQAIKSTTLSTAHGDGGIVSQYGYGYFHAASTAEPSLHSSGIGSHLSETFVPDPAQENSQANAALSALMSGQYVFHSYNTWSTAQENEGLYLVKSGDAVNNQPPYGTWTLQQGDENLSVRLNPFFADALSLAWGGTPDAGVPLDLPGSAENPYEVRAIEQLQFINWNINQKKTTQRMDIWNKANYPYLCYGSDGNLTIRAFSWEQTHDLQGEKGVTYTPIAEVYDQTTATQGDLFGWFGGTYNGNNYLIADVNIKGQSESSCVGLFGAVFNGTLQNIVLYSADGTATVEGNNSGESRWYAIGGLAGLAGSTTGSSVVNCTVSGYTIQDTHQSTKAGGWGGTGLGGLIGVSDMSLKGCTAVTNIKLNSRDNDNVRVGGLVGSCQGSISSCYSGGTITVSSSSSTPSDRGIYVGGIVGGIYMKPLRVGGGSDTVGHSGNQLQNTLNNCYTYAVLPAASGNRYIKGLYALGGSGELNSWQGDGNADHGWTNYGSNFYLGSLVLQNNTDAMIGRNDLASVTSLTYAEMSDTTSDSGLLKRLNSNGGGFSTVTTETSSGDPLSGRYSFGNAPSLLGKDYPFPTILTQPSTLVESGKANVHYGDWPLAGIRREYGALPVSLDLFANYDDTSASAIWTEPLSLSNVPAGGSWTAASADRNIAVAALSGNESSSQTLTITGKKAGSTTVTVTYTVGGQSYPLSIEVNVTAELRLAVQPSPAQMFTNETMVTPLLLLKQDNTALDSLQSAVALSDFTVEFDSQYLTLASIGQDNGLTLTTSSGAQTGTTQITAGFHFTYLGNTYPASSVLTIQLVAPEITLQPAVLTFSASAAEPQQTLSYTATEPGAFTLQVGGAAQTVTNLRIVGFELDDDQRNSIWAEWAKDENGEEQEGVLLITAYPQPYYPATASLRVQFQFDCEGSTHTLWQELEVQIKKQASEGTEGSQP